MFEWDDALSKKRPMDSDQSTVTSRPETGPSKRPRPQVSSDSHTVEATLVDVKTVAVNIRKLFVDPAVVSELTSLPAARQTTSPQLATVTLLLPLSQMQAASTTVAKYGVKIVCPTPAKVLERLEAYRAREEKRLASGDCIDQSLDKILPSEMCSKLMQFQWEGVDFALQRGGRCLIGDDMGLGKTLQAIAVARVYRRDWPLLIVCPSSLRLNWKDEILKWLGEDVDEDEILVVMKGSDCDRRLSLINIVSYELVQKIPMAQVSKCKFVVCDESHYLKSMNSKRTKFLVPVIRKARRALLLSGTPALSRPVELFSQLNALEQNVFPKYGEFTERYCNAHHSRWGWDVSGSSNLEELHTLMRGTCLIRRKKDDVLTQLPPKQRQVIWVEVKPSLQREIQRAQKELQEVEAMASHAGADQDNTTLQNAVRAASQKLYKLSGAGKLDAVQDYIKDLVAGDVKLIVFAHHREILDALSTFSKDKLKVPYIRIDGDTPQTDRQGLCSEFQTNAQCRVAVLSITAAGVGLTLTAASVVVFAELYWNPGSLLQAEDRAHRIGQRDCVLVKYILGRDTHDQSIWRTVKNKLTVVGKSLTGTAAQLEVSKEAKSAGRPGDGDIRTYLTAPATSEKEDAIEGFDSDKELSIVSVRKTDSRSGSSDAVDQGWAVRGGARSPANEGDAPKRDLFPLELNEEGPRVVPEHPYVECDADMRLARVLRGRRALGEVAPLPRTPFG